MAVQVNVSADQKKLVDSINKGVNAYNRRFASSNSINLKINERSFTQPLGRISGAVDDFGAAMAASNARVIAFGASTAVLGSAVAGFRSLARASIEVEKNLADVNRILQLTTSDLQTFGKELFNISKRTATSFNDASKALLEFSRQGLDASETLKRTNDALTLTRLAGLGAEASVAALTATVNGFSKSGITTTQVLNKLVAVEQSFAVSARDLSQGLARTGQAAQEAGVDIDQLNALISAAQQKTARGGAVIGNALKTIFTRLQRSDTLDRLEEFNVAVRDVQGNTLPAALILQNFAASYDKLADAQRAQLSEQVAGVYQVNILKAIISDLNSEQSIYNGALAKGSQATNEAARANAQLNQTLSALLVQTGNNAQQLASTIGSVTFDPLAKSAAKAANSILETFTGLLTGEGLASDFANGLLKGIRNVLGGPGAVAAFYTLFKLVQNSFTYVAQALPQLAGITTETQKRQSLEQAILGILQQENAVSRDLLAANGNQKRQAEILLGVAKQQTAEYQKQKTIASGLAATLRTQGVSIGSRGLQTGKTRSGGFIPNSTKQAERSGALAGGYMPGKVINSPVGGVMNTAEQVKYVPGFAQPFINPPKTSRAGRLHRVESLRQTGVNPYMHEGFVPNFAKTNHFQRGRDFEKVVGDLIKIPAKHNAPIDYEKVKSDALAGLSPNLMFNKAVYDEKTYADAHVGLGHTAAQIISKIINHEKGSLNLRKKPNGPFSVTNDLVEIIGKGADKEVTKKSAYESLNITAQNNLRKVRSPKILKGSKFHATFQKDKVNIPNFAAAYRNAYTGKLNNSAIARGLKSGDLSASEAAAMGYTTSGSKIDARKAKRASFVNSLNYKQVYVPWDIEAFRAKGSAAKGQTFNQTQGSTYEKYILNSLRSGIKGTTSLGAPFALPARPDAINGNLLKGKRNSRIDGYSLSAGEMYEMKSGDKGDTLAGLQNKFIQGLKNNPEILNPKRKWKNYIFRTTKAKGRGASNGFIPNLAYKGEVMDLEESISGEKAIYSNTPFPHVRNASQPTFASAIADHGGLSNALKDSYGNQSAAGMVYGGFVPNFADNERAGVSIGKLNLEKLQTQVGNTTKNLIDLSDEFQLAEMFASDIAKDLKSGSIGSETAKKKITELGKNLGMTNKQTQKLEKNIRKASKTSGSRFGAGSSTALAFAGPMAAGLLEQTFFGDRQRSDMSGGERMGQSVLSTGLTSVSTGIAIGDSLGIPFGGLLGGIAGAGLGVVSAFNAAELSAEELAQVNQKLVEENQKNISAGSSFVQAQKKLNDLIQAGASDKEIENASKRVRESFNSISDVKLQDAFSDAGTNVGAMTEKLNQFTDQYARSAAAAELGTLITDKGGFFKGDNSIRTQLNQGDPNKIGQLLIQSGVDLQKLNEAAYQGSRRFGELSNKITKATEEAGLDPSEETRARLERKGIGDLTMQRYKRMGIIDADADSDLYTGLEGFVEDFEKDIEDALLDSGLKKGTDSFKQSFDFLSKFLFSDKGLGVIEDLTEDKSTFDLTDRVNKFKAVSSRTFNKIFRDINDDFASLSSDTLKLVERQSSSQKIEASVLNFTETLNDKLSSFIQGNLPDFDKYRFAQSAASQKADTALLKLTQDYSNFEQNQTTERRKALETNAKSLTEVFEKNLFKSAAVGKIFENNILPELKKGNYDVDLDASLKKSRSEALLAYNQEFGDLPTTGIFGVKGSAVDGNPTFDINAFTDKQRIKKIDDAIKAIKDRVASQLESSFAKPESLDEIKDNSAKKIAKLQELRNKISLTTNQAAADELKSKLKEKELALELFDIKAAGARDEIELSQELTRIKIQAEKVLATQQAKIRSENLIRTRAAEISSTRLGFAGNVDQARRSGQIALAENALNDPRANFGLGLKDITENRIKAEQEIVEKRRAAEDAQMLLELKQSAIRLQAEIENTNALKNLNESIIDLLANQLRNDASVVDIQQYRRQNAGSLALESDVNSIFSPADIAKYETLQRINASQSSSSDGGSSALKEALDKQKESKNIDFEQLRIAAEKDGFQKSEIDLLEESFNNKKDVLVIEREIADIIRKRNNDLSREGVDLAGNFKAGVGAMRSESDAILNNLANTAPSRFADGMANALSQVAEGSKSLGDAFTDMAIDFGRMLQQEVFRALAQRAVGSALSGGLSFLGGSQKGGIIKAQNGMYISGGRTGDRNLAMLEDGEYVLNRNAVRMMGGPKSLDTLNYSMAPRFNRGGGFSMSPSLGSDGKFGGDLLLNNRNIGGINSDMFTAYAYENSPYFQGMREDAKKALQRRIQKRFEKKQKRAQLVSGVVGAVGSMFMGAAMSGINPAPAGTTVSSSTSLDAIMSGGPRSFAPNAAVPKFMMSPRYNSGGFVPHGSRLSDTIPAMLTGGEYVMNNKAVRKYGLGTMNAINSGSAQGSGASNSNTTNTSTNNNSTNISVSVDRSGNTVYGSNTSSHEQQDIVISKQMAKEISGIVMKNISNEKRYGGALYRS